MNIRKYYNISLDLTDTERNQLLEALCYIRHRFTDHVGSGVYRMGCKEGFIKELIKVLENKGD